MVSARENLQEWIEVETISVASFPHKPAPPMQFAYVCP